MRWMKVAGFVFIFGLVAACKIDAKTPNQCQADDQCPEGAYCDVGRALCVLACEKAGCLEGHFCDPDSHFCKDYCPHKCPIPPANATLLCGEVCVYACNDGFRECAGREGACLSDSSDPTACGATCEVCTVPWNATATCNGGACGYTCNGGSYDNAGVCEVCDKPQHCGASCTDCTANWQACNGSQCVADTTHYTRRLSATGEPTVRDNNNGLIWQGCSTGLKGNDCETQTIVASQMYWDLANSYCAGLTWDGLSGWRLPTLVELEGLRDSSQTPAPFIDKTNFPNMPPLLTFWSSTWGLYTDFYWTIYFAQGMDGYEAARSGAAFQLNIRCIRGP